MRPIHIKKPGVTRFQRMAENAKRKKDFAELVKRLGKPKADTPAKWDTR